LAAAGVAMALVLGACGTANVQVYKKMDPGASYAGSVAVLPFTTADDMLEKEKKPHEILREVFFNYFSYLGYTDLPLKEVDRRLEAEGQ